MIGYAIAVLLPSAFALVMLTWIAIDPLDGDYE